MMIQAQAQAPTVERVSEPSPGAASDSGIDRFLGGGASDLERLTSAAGMEGSVAGGRVLAILRNGG
jgi:hypothetical protein